MVQLNWLWYHATEIHCLLLSANEIYEGYAFTPVSQSFCSQWGGVSMSRPGGGVCPGGVARPRPGGCVVCVQARARGVSARGGCPGPDLGGMYPSMHWGRRLLLRTVRILTGMHSCLVKILLFSRLQVTDFIISRSYRSQAGEHSIHAKRFTLALQYGAKVTQNRGISGIGHPETDVETYKNSPVTG